MIGGLELYQDFYKIAQEAASSKTIDIHSNPWLKHSFVRNGPLSAITEPTKAIPVYGSSGKLYWPN